MSMHATEAERITGLRARLIKPANGSSLSPHLKALADSCRFQLIDDSKTVSRIEHDPKHPDRPGQHLTHRVEHIVVAGPSFDDCVDAWRKLNGHGQRRNGGRA